MGHYGPTMRRGLLHVLAWLLATGAAVTLSWWGVSTVMEGTAYDPPRALPIPAGEERAQAVSSSTHRPAPEPSKDEDDKGPEKSREPSETPSTGSAPPDPTPSRTASPSKTPSAPEATAAGEVKSYDTRGGRAVFDLGETSASLVSATPGAGWSMQVWKTETWIRVEFASGADRVTVFCTWHDGPPRVEIATY